MTTSTGFCYALSIQHHECGGRCGEPHKHACDAPHPSMTLRCVMHIGHDGGCSGGNGPTWETPEPYANRDPIPKTWRAKPSTIPRPSTEETLEDYP